MFGKPKPVGALDFVRGEKRLKPARIIFVRKANTPYVDFAGEKSESRIETSIHEAN